MKKALIFVLLFLCAFILHAGNIDTISPSEGARGTTITVTITGIGTSFLQGSTTAVTLENFQSSPTTIWANSFNAQSDETLSAEFNLNGCGYYTLRTHNLTDGWLSLGNAFYIQCPQIIGATPSTASAGETLQVTITGQYTHFAEVGSNTLTLLSQSSTTIIHPGNISVQNNTTLDASFNIPYNATNGLYDVRVYNQADGLVWGEGLIDIAGPAITGISPQQFIAGQNIQVTITGQYTQFTQSSSTTVGLSNFMGTNTSIYGQNTLAIDDVTLQTELNLPNNLYSGIYSLWLMNSFNGLLTYPVNVEGLNPEIISIAPAQASTGESIQVTITGSQTIFTQGSQTVRLVSYQSSPTTVYSFADDLITPTKMVSLFNIPASWTGEFFCDLIVTLTDYGSLVVPSGFGINTAGIAGVDVDSLIPGQNILLNVIGTNTHFLDAGDNNVTIQINGLKITTAVQGTVTQLYDNEHMEVGFNIPSDAAGGDWDLVVTNSIDGTMTFSSKIFIDNQTSVHHNPINELEVYPNPVRNKLNITIPDNCEFSDLKIISASGRLIHRRQLAPVRASSLVIDMENLGLSDGIYYIKLEGEDHTWISRIIKLNN